MQIMLPFHTFGLLASKNHSGLFIDVGHYIYVNHGGITFYCNHASITDYEILYIFISPEASMMILINRS